LVVALILAGGAAVCQADSLTLSVGGQVSEFEITHCRTDTYQSRQLLVDAEITAVGALGGQPAVLFLTKSHHTSGAGTQEFSDFDVFMTELSPELRNMPTLAARAKITEDHGILASQRTKEIMADYTKEKMDGLPMDQAMAKGDEMSQRLADLSAEIKALQVPSAESWGVATLEGSKIGFEGDDLSQDSSQKPHEALAPSGPVRVSAECTQ